jgi:hypothetical protein
VFGGCFDLPASLDPRHALQFGADVFRWGLKIAENGPFESQQYVTDLMIKTLPYLNDHNELKKVLRDFIG